MNGSAAKKRARDLQAITGMTYQAAHRAVVTGKEYDASVRSGLTLSDFVTPKEQRIWLQVNTNDLRCADGRHWMATEDLGQCVGCGVTMASRFDEYGDKYDALISEDEFLEHCVTMRMYYNWAPPMGMLTGMTQHDYFRRYWRPTPDDDWDESPTPASAIGTGDDDPWGLSNTSAPFQLSSQHLDLLRVVDELEEPGRFPGTVAVGERLLELWKDRGGAYAWFASAPWHGTNPYASELEAADLLEVNVGIATYRQWGAPIESPTQYWLGLTDLGRNRLAQAPAQT